ncbi:hypothetical protein HD554DRAFT_2069224 [Boletus coccyginus]|nr:hypothetical protein HD554DRAFT_2069224 [Boletus coccyginus]
MNGRWLGAMPVDVFLDEFVPATKENYPLCLRIHSRKCPLVGPISPLLMSEHEIYGILHHHGTPNIPEHVAGGDIDGDRVTTQKFVGAPWLCVRPISPYQHYRLVHVIIGRALFRFEYTQQLVTAFFDALQGAPILSSTSVLLIKSARMAWEHSTAIGSTVGAAWQRKSPDGCPRGLRLAALPVGVYLRSGSQPQVYHPVELEASHLPTRIPHSASSLLEVACPLARTRPGQLPQ